MVVVEVQTDLHRIVASAQSIYSLSNVGADITWMGSATALGATARDVCLQETQE
jgi:hypothetical protein